jgi:glutamine transport system substrate-binding protein
VAQAGVSEVLTVGIDDSPPPPMEIGEPGEDDFTGYEVDILEAVAGRLGVGLRYRRAVWSQILAELGAGSIDVVCTAATYTEERAREFDYGRPYLDMALAVVVRADDDADSLDGRAFAVRIATTAEDCIRARLRPSRVTTFEYNRETYDALAGGEADAVVDDSPIAAWFARQDPRLRVVKTLPGTESHYAMMFARGSELRSRMDAALLALEEEGALERLRRKWFTDA